MKGLVMLINERPLTTSIIISGGVNNLHKNVILLIERHKKRIERFGVLPIQTDKPEKGSKGGRPKKYYLLNEEQATFLISLMDNSEDVLNFKENLVREFFRYRKQSLILSINKANEIWLDERKNIKQVRKSTTDTIKRFVEYAKEQGSSNADRYYCNITKMENKALFVIETKYKNIRDILNLKQLSELKQADEIIEKALDDGMNEKMYYKDIFKLAKKRVTIFSELKGRSIIPELMQIGVNNNKENGDIKLI
jgi:phage regulator Rha-like protein